MEKSFSPLALCALLIASFTSPMSSASAQSASQTISFLGMPVLRAHATALWVETEWERATLSLRITALVDLGDRRLGAEAARRMVSDAGLDKERADRFEKVLADLGDMPKGQTLSAVCAPKRALIIEGASKLVRIDDAQTAHAFCSIWFSTSGDEALRLGLGLR